MTNTEADVLTALDESFAGVHLDRPVETIVAAGRARRRRQRFAVTAAALAVAAAVVAIALPTDDRSATVPQAVASPTAGDELVHVHLAAFTVDQNADKTVKLTVNMKQAIDVPGLRTALTQAGVPSLISVFPVVNHTMEIPRTCAMNGLPELQQVVAGEPGFVFVIHVDKMPPGSVLWIAAFQNGDRVEAPGISVQYLNSIPQHCR